MNIKKLFAVLAGVSMLATQLIPAGALAATYSAELQEAYNWAYSKGVTTMSPIDNANMYGAITRSEMAKMLSVYATEVLGMTPDTSAACTFSDIASVKGDLHDYIIESCQLGIMGQGITAFRPYDTISRAEFGTALSRVLWGSANEGGTPYYAKHLDALKTAGIMTQIANAESTKEVRGYVMLMLMRSEGNAVVDCEDPMIVIACTTDPASCPAACREAEDNTSEEEEVVKSGSLVVKSSAAETRKVIVSVNGGVSDLDTLTFKTSEEVTLSKVVLEKYGYSTGAILSGVWLEDEDGNVITNKASINKGKVTLTLKKDYKVVDGTLNATIVVETNAEDEVTLMSALGGTIGFKVADVVSTAKDVDLGDYKAYTYDIVMYDGATIELSARGGEKEYNFEAGKLYEVAKFKIKAPVDSAVLVRGFTLTDLAEEIDVDRYLDKVVVKVAGEEVKATTSLNKKDQLVVSLKNDARVEAGKNVEFSVEMSFTEDFDTFGNELAYVIYESSDISAIDAKTESRVTPVDAGYDVLVCVFYGGKVKLTNVKLGALEYAMGSNDVKIAEGTLTLTQAIEGDLFLSMSGEAAEAIYNVRLVIGDEEFEGTKRTGGFSFDNIEIEEGGKVKLLVDIDEVTGLEGAVVEFELGDWEDLEYVDARGYDSDIDVSGSISVSKLTLKAPKGSLTNDLKSEDDKSFRNKEVNTYVIFDGAYTAKKLDVYLNSFVVSGNTSADLTDIGRTKITFHLYLNGKEVEDATYNFERGSAVADFSDYKVKADESVDVVLEAEIDAKADADVDFKQFTLGLGGIDENDNEVDYATRKTVNVSIVSVGSVIIEASGTAKTVAKKSVADLASVTAKPDGASEVVIEEVTVTLSGEALEAIDWDDYSADEVFTLYVNEEAVEFADVDLDDLEDGITLVADGLNVTAKSAGVPVRLELSEALALDVTVSEVTVNGEPSTKIFRKMFVPALVKINAQDDDGISTTYTFSVDKKSGDHVSHVAIFTGDSAEAYPINGGDEITNGYEESLFDGDASYYITAIQYCINEDATNTCEDANTGLITIKKVDFSDFFKLPGTSKYASLNKAKD